MIIIRDKLYQKSGSICRLEKLAMKHDSIPLNFIVKFPGQTLQATYIGSLAESFWG